MWWQLRAPSFVLSSHATILSLTCHALPFIVSFSIATREAYKCLDYLFTGLSPLLLRSMEVVFTVSLIIAPYLVSSIIGWGRNYFINHFLNISSATWTYFPISQCRGSMTTLSKFDYIFCFRARLIPSAKRQKKWWVSLSKVHAPTINFQRLDSHLNEYVCTWACWVSSNQYFGLVSNTPGCCVNI